MGSLTDFLFEGSAPPSTTTYGSATQNIPQWMSDYTQGLIARANAVAAEPFQQFPGPRIAGFTPDTQSAFDMTRQVAGAYQQPLNQALGLASQAGGANITGAAQPYLGTSAGMTLGAVAPGQGGLSVAQPYLQQAAQMFPGAVQQYMDPYVQNVIAQGTRAAMQNLNENIMPGINNRFTAAGQYGSSANQREADRAARDITSQIQTNANAALSNAYQNAGSLFNADVNRMAGLAGTAGALGSAQQGAQLQAAGQLGGLGQTAGMLTGQQGALQLGAGQQLGNLGAQTQQLGLTGAGALDTIGQMQQQLNQQNLNTAYQDFLNQTQYPRQTIDWMSSVIRGLPTPTAIEKTAVGPSNIYQPSPLAQLASAGTGLAGLSKVLSGGG